MPPRLSAAQRALEVVEVASIICGHLRGLISSDEKTLDRSKSILPPPESTANVLARHLTPIARVNKAFYTASTPHVWETVDTLVPLLEDILGGERVNCGDERKQALVCHDSTFYLHAHSCIPRSSLMEFLWNGGAVLRVTRRK